MDIDEIVVDDTGDSTVSADKIGQTQTPWTPVATHLAHHIFALGARLCKSLVNLCHRVDLLVVNLLQRCALLHTVAQKRLLQLGLRMASTCHQRGQQYCCDSFHKKLLN